MDSVDSYRQTIMAKLAEYAAIPYAYGELASETVFDRDNDRYLLLTVGWDEGKRIHSCLIHIDIIDGHVFVQKDNTEVGIARELAESGILKEHIVLGFRSPSLRKYTDYAVA